MSSLKNSKYSFSELSSQRLIITGIAALWIVFHHAYKLDFSTFTNLSVFGKALCAAFAAIKPAGNVGVEMFLICSGLGLYYSFSKNSNLLSFYKKRAIRILPALLIVSSLYYAFKGLGIKEYLMSVFLVDYYTKGNSQFWYFALIILLYLFYPVIHKIVERSKDFTVMCLIAALIVAGFIITYVIKADLDTRYYALLRVPSFIIGVWLGKKSLQKSQINSFWVLACTAVSVVCFVVVTAMHMEILPMEFVNSKYIYYFINIPFSVSFSIVISAVFSRTKLRFTKAVIGFFGVFSLELYLIFERVTEACENVLIFNDATYITYYIATFFVTVVLSVLLQNVCSKITSVFTKEYKKF